MFPWNFFPFNKEMQTNMQNLKPEDINQYIQDIMGNMNQMLHPSNQNNMNPLDMMKMFHSPSQRNATQSATPNHTSLTYNVFDTHDYIFVLINITNEEWLQQIKLYHTSNLLIIENIPNDRDKHSIPLPALVKKKGTTAKFKDGILEVKIPKNLDFQYSEVDITDSF